MESERQFSSPTESGLFMSRKERGAIAAQACETCRNRKQKCSEGRPKCSSCEKLQTPCVYRSPPITKKDRTLLHILERLKSVESKIDGLSTKERPGSAYTTPAPIFSEADIVSLPSTSATSPSQSNPSSCYRYVSSVSQMVEWPKIRQLIENLETSPLLDGLSMRQSIQCAKKGLPFDRVQAISMSPDGTLNVNLPFTELEYGTTSVNWDSIQRLSKAFFDTYNFMHPLLDREAFNSTIHNVIGCGFGDDTRSILAFLVLALGEVALAISSGFSVLVDKNHSSNLEGFTSDRPPGLAYFNEARKRMGFVMAEVSLENVQMFSLAALYYDSCGRYAESRRLAATASLACQSLVMSKLEESNQHHANLLRRNFWHCCIMELSWHMELDIPTTGLDKLGNAVGLPELAPLVPGENYVGNQMPSFQNQFISEVVLHRLSASFHSTLTSAFASSLSNQLSASPPAADSPYTILKQLAGQLEQWRAMLPEFLQWRDDQSLALTDPNQFVMFTLSMGSPTASYSYTGDIQIALFRTRYYYNKYLLYRPFVFKALHYPLSVTSEDAQGAANCLLASLRWPIAMSPPCLSKRLLPLTALWSQNLFGVLVLLYLSSHHPVLARIRTNYCGQQFEFEATETIEMYTDWLRDMKKTDPGAERCWSVVKELFQVGM